MPRNKNEPVEEWLKRVFHGKKVAVIGARFGTLNKILSLFGADAYGVDTHPDAEWTSQERGLDVKLADAKDIGKAYPDRRPDFVVSYHFFDPNYWRSMEPELRQVLEGIRRHSTEKTIHVHICMNELTEFPGFHEIKRRTMEPVGHVAILRKA